MLVECGMTNELDPSSLASVLSLLVCENRSGLNPCFHSFALLSCLQFSLPSVKTELYGHTLLTMEVEITELKRGTSTLLSLTPPSIYLVNPSLS